MSRSVLRAICTITILLITLAGFFYYFSSHAAVRDQLRQTSAATLATLFVLYLGVIVALSLVTMTTLRLCRVTLRPAETGLLTMYTTVINFFGPLQSGPAFRGLYLKRKHGLNIKRYAAATLVFYMLYAFISGIFLLSSIAGWWLAVIGVVLAFVGFAVRDWKALKRFEALDLTAVYALGLATLLQVVVVAIIYFVELHSIDHSVRLSQAIVYAGAANFSLFVSITPGAIGFRESFLLFSQRLHHISSDTIIAANILDRAMYIVLLAVVGIIILVTHSKQRLQNDT